MWACEYRNPTIWLAPIISFPRSRVVMHTKVSSWEKAVKIIEFQQPRCLNGITKQPGMLRINAMYSHAGAWEPGNILELVDAPLGLSTLRVVQR